MREVIGRALYRYGWDTRCRSREALEVIRDALDGDGLLDVGCGPGGIATFLPRIDVTGIDVSEPTNPPPNLRFVLGSITDLPFKDRAFGVVACIDTLEHLPPDERTAGIAELVRVTGRALVITCPNGETAQRCDGDFRRALVDAHRAVPDWVTEHQSHPYPTLEGVLRDIGAVRTPRITARYSESTRVRRIILAAAVRSNAAWAAANLAAGLLLPVLPKPSSTDSYRFVVRADFG